MFVTADGDYPPVIHIDSSEPLISDMTGKVITDKLWGIYFKRDRNGVQGGAAPLEVDGDVAHRPVPLDDRRRPGRSRTCGARRCRTR